MAVDTIRPARADIPKQTDNPGHEQTARDPLGALLCATECPPLTDQEIRIATQRRSQAAPLLAAAVLHRALNDGSAEGLMSYVTHEKAAKDLATIPAPPRRSALMSMSKTQLQQESRRREQRSRLTQLIKEHEDSSQSFAKALEFASDAADDFEAQYTQKGKTNLEAVYDLYDRTDDSNQVVLGALPKATLYDGPQRVAIIGADRVLRFMLDQALQNRSGVA